MAVAIEGEQAEPRVAAPAALRPVLGFSRLSAAAYATIARVVDDDGIFRARVAEAAQEDEVGPAGWLWLQRPVGWAELAGALPVDDVAPARADRRGDKDAVAKHRKAAASAEAARKRAVEQVAEARAREHAAEAERRALAARVEVLQDERNAALRHAKALEAELATARRDLKMARAATRQAEHELLELRSAPVAPIAPVAPPPPPSPLPPVEAARAVLAASAAAADLAASLADAAAALAGPVPTSSEPEPAARPGWSPVAADRSRRGRSTRVAPTLPPGVFDGTLEAHRHLIGSGANLVVVDGYNLSRAAWTGLSTEEERRRTVALLDDVQARSGGRVVVVFDGDDAVTAPKASRSVRVRFSATGQTADDAIAELVGATPLAQPVVVVSSDRAVAADARRQGAVALGARAFLRAAGR